MDSSREKYLDKIVEYLVNKTKYDTDHLNLYIIKFPFSDGWEIFGSHREMSDIYDISPERFGIHRWNFDQEMINLFDLLEHESDYVWEEYFKGARFFGNEYAKSDGLINESVDKQEKYLDKVVKHMIERFKDTEDNKWQRVDMKSFVDFGETFGLTDLELNYVYHKYFFLKGWNEKDISSWYLDNQHIYNRRMNESHVDVLPYMDDTEFIKNFTKDLNEKQKGYLDKVVEQLLRETDIDYKKWRINYPFFRDTTYSFHYTLPFSGPFIRYCNNIFPLSEDEMRYVHFMYTGILHGKIRKYYVDNDIYNKYYNVMGTKDIINFDR